MRFIMFLGIIFVIGMLIFGGNPLREFQKKQKELRDRLGSDELTIITNLYLEELKNSSNVMGALNGEPTEPTNSKTMLNSMKTSGVDNNSKRNTDLGGIAVKVAEPDSDLESNYVGVEVSNNAKADEEKSRASNYYPPIVGLTDNIEVVQSQTQKPVVLTGKEPRLRSGQVIAFDGTLVYIIDAAGNKKTMPDGTYNLEDGRQIVVSNGRNMMQ